MNALRLPVLGLWIVLLAPWARPAGATCPPNPAGGPSLIAFDTLPGGDLDLGWTGSFFNFPMIANMRLRGCLSHCDSSTDPTCDVNGPTGEATVNGEVLGAPLPLVASGVGLCVVNRFAEHGQAGFTGTVDLRSGATSLDLSLIAHLYLTNRVRVCPRCERGTCDDGPNRGRACAVHGTVRVEESLATNRVFQLSRDCPPDREDFLSIMSVRLSTTTGTVTTPGTGGSRPCAENVAKGVPPQDDACAGSLCSTSPNCVGTACVSMVSHPVDGSMVCVDAKGGLSQFCCNEGLGLNSVPCHPTFVGGPGIVREGALASAVTPSPWGDEQYPKTASGTVLVSTFCQQPTGSSVVDLTMGLPGPGALILPVDETWAVSVCGNGILEFDEQCDDGNTAADDCCTALCRWVPDGEPCGDDGIPCTSDTCDGAGACTHPVEQAGIECRASEDACDAGDACDGVAVECPSVGRGQACPIVVPDAVAEGQAIPVTCEAVKAGDVRIRSASRCVAVGFAAEGVSGGAGTTLSRPHGPQVTRRAAKKLKRVAGESLRRRVLALELNRTGKRLLRQNGTLDVALRVTVHHGGASHTEHRLVRVGKPG